MTGPVTRPATGPAPSDAAGGLAFSVADVVPVGEEDALFDEE